MLSKLLCMGGKFTLKGRFLGQGVCNLFHLYFTVYKSSCDGNGVKIHHYCNLCYFHIFVNLRSCSERTCEHVYKVSSFDLLLVLLYKFSIKSPKSRTEMTWVATVKLFCFFLAFYKIGVSRWQISNKIALGQTEWTDDPLTVSPAKSFLLSLKTCPSLQSWDMSNL